MDSSDSTESKSGFYLFGRDIMAIPEFRHSFIVGISSCLGSTLLTFLFTSNSRKSANVGFLTFMGVTFPYWFYRREQEYKRELEFNEVKEALKKATAEEYIITDTLDFTPESY